MLGCLKRPPTVGLRSDVLPFLVQKHLGMRVVGICPLERFKSALGLLPFGSHPMTNEETPFVYPIRSLWFLQCPEQTGLIFI